MRSKKEGNFFAKYCPIELHILYDLHVPWYSSETEVAGWYELHVLWYSSESEVAGWYDLHVLWYSSESEAAGWLVPVHGKE